MKIAAPVVAVALLVVLPARADEVDAEAMADGAAVLGLGAGFAALGITGGIGTAVSAVYAGYTLATADVEDEAIPFVVAPTVGVAIVTAGCGVAAFVLMTNGWAMMLRAVEEEAAPPRARKEEPPNPDSRAIAPDDDQ